MLTSSFSKIDVYILVGLGTTDCTTTVHRGCLLSLSSPRPPWVSHYWVATRGECWDDWYIWYNLVYHLLWGSSILQFQNYDKMSSQILNQFITKRKDELLLKVYSNTYLKVIFDLVSSEKSVAETQMRAVMMRGPWWPEQRIDIIEQFIFVPGARVNY